MSTTEPARATTSSQPVEGVSAKVAGEADRHCQAFQTAKPFKHWMIDDFFETEFAEELLREFPKIGRAHV